MGTKWGASEGRKLIVDPGTEVLVTEQKLCDMCKLEGDPVRAHFDGKTVFGPWAFMCKQHHDRFGVGVGVGRGQRLIVEREAS